MAKVRVDNCGYKIAKLENLTGKMDNFLFHYTRNVRRAFTGVYKDVDILKAKVKLHDKQIRSIRNDLMLFWFLQCGIDWLDVLYQNDQDVRIKKLEDRVKELEIEVDHDDRRL